MPLNSGKLLAIAVAIVAIAAASACRNEPPCPPGTKQMGEGPPDGSETWCEKTVDGKAVKEGRFTLYGPDGQKTLEGIYHAGKQTGEWRSWYDSGQLSAIDHYEGGVQQGPHSGWYPNGQKSAEGAYVKGQKDGTWKRWDPAGFRNWEEHYRDGKKVTS
jgi:hypothetical protein